MRVISHLTYVLYPQPRGGDYTESIQYTGSHEKAGLKISIQKMKVMASGPITSWQIDGGKNGNSDRLFSWAPKSLGLVTAAMKLKDICSLEENI